jgi:indolepyruvate ferredoxin oxidoreductase
VATESTELTLAVARAYFRLLAYKDEYEVARLHTTGDFLPTLRRNFGEDFKLRFHFSPPLVAGMDTETGRPKKYEFGGWMLPVLKVLARLKFLRGTRLDPFGRSQERRTERQLIVEYERLVDEVLEGFDPRKFGLAVEILGLAESIKGYGPIKDQSVVRYRRSLERLRARWREHTSQSNAPATRASAA